MTVTAKDPEQVRVVAPSTLNAGYTFQVDLNGRPLTVKVPEGGVKEGQTFDAEVIPSDDDVPATNPDFVAAADPEIAVAEAVPVGGPVGGPIVTKTVVNNPDGTQTVTEETRYPDGRITTTTTTTLASNQTATTPTAQAEFTVPTGKWRYDLFSCCDTCSSGMFWMTWCLHYIAVGQLLQRLKLDCLGSPSSGDGYKRSCMIWTVLACVTWAVGLLFSGISEGYSIVFLYSITGFLSIVALTQARYYMRQKYSIPADCCADNGCLSDCCCMYWCTCCGVIQMMRHTHDEKKYVYNCTSQTGLNPDVPEIV